jgi:hypothetical protein
MIGVRPVHRGIKRSGIEDQRQVRGSKGRSADRRAQSEPASPESPAPTKLKRVCRLAVSRVGSLGFKRDSASAIAFLAGIR